MPSPSCIGSNLIDFIYDHAGVRKIKSAATPTIYPNQFYTDFGGGSGNQFKHIFIGSERILTKKSRIAPDREHWYYHGDHLDSTAMVTNELSQLVDAIHYFPFGEVWLEERPSSLPTDYFFTAKEFDPETGFYNFGARYLDPRFSKWITADPVLGDYLSGKIGQGVFAPTHLALYTYGLNNPATYFDPNGLWTWGQVGWAAARGVGYGLVGVAVVGAIVVTGGAVAYVGAPIIGAAITTLWCRDGGCGGDRGGAYTATTVATGHDYISGRDLSDDERIETGVELGAGFATGLAVSRVGAPAVRYIGSRFGRGPIEEPVPVARGDCSFAEGPPVATDDGLKSISVLKIGDRVLARSEETGAYAFQPITQVFRHEDPVKVHLTLEDTAKGVTEVIETTPEHRFYVPGRGFVPARSLKRDDAVSGAAAGALSVVHLISGQSGTLEVLRVKNLTLENQPFLAYDLEVGQDHTFFVGGSGAWVHNCPPQGSQNPNTRATSGRGSTLHSDKPGHLPEQLRQQYPDTEFAITKPGVEGQDVKITGGKHPSDYPGSTWPKGVDHGDFKPDTPTGRSRFRSDQANKWTEPTHMLPYDPKTGLLK